MVEHPDITHAMRTGYPPGGEPKPEPYGEVTATGTVELMVRCRRGDESTAIRKLVDRMEKKHGVAIEVDDVGPFTPCQ